MSIRKITIAVSAVFALGFATMNEAYSQTTDTITNSTNSDRNSVNEYEVDAANDTAIAVIVPASASELQIVKDVVNQDNYRNGFAFQYLITVTNNGPSTASGIVVEDELPEFISFNSTASESQGTASGVITSSNGLDSFSWNVGSLADGASATILVNVTPDTSGTFTNTAYVSGVNFDPILANNEDTAKITIDPVVDIVAAKLVNGLDTAQAYEGDTVTYTLTYYNAGPDQASGVNIYDALPSGVTFLEFVGTGTAYSGGASGPNAIETSGEITLTGATIPQSGGAIKVVITFKATVDAN